MVAVLKPLRTWLVALVLLGGIAFAVAHFTEFKKFAALLNHARPQLLILALLLQLSTYVSVALCWAGVLRAAGSPRSVRSLLPLSIAKLFADQAVPTAGVSGNFLLVDRLLQLDVRRGDAVSALVLSIVGYYAAFGCFALAVLALLWIHHEATLALAVAVTIFLAVAAAIPAGVLAMARKGRQLPRPIRRFATLRRLLELFAEAPQHLLKDKRLIAKCALFNGLVFLADAATLWVVLAATGARVGFETALIAFIMASIAVTLGPTPMGLGSFEGVAIAMLRLLGVDLESAVAGTLLLRGLTLWLPLLPGLLISRRMVSGRHRSNEKSVLAPPKPRSGI